VSPRSSSGGAGHRGLLSLGVGLAAAGVGAAIGVAAERAAVGRPLLPRRGAVGDGEDYGGLRAPAQVVSADDGTRLHVEVEDPPTEPAVTLVFSHGYALTLDSWHYQRKALRALEGRLIGGLAFRMVFYDQRGHGRSAAGPPGSGDIDQVGSDLERVIEATAPSGPLVLIGHSMGGMTVMSLAARRPDLVAERALGVAFLSTSAGGIADVDLGLSRLGRLVVRLAPPTVRALTRTPRLVEQTRRIGSDLEAVLVRRYSYASPVSHALVAFTAEMIASTRLDVISDFLPAFPTHDKREALSALDGRELLVIVGDSDLLTPAEHSADIVARLPGAEHVLVPNGGHMLMLEHPGVVNGHLIALIERSVKHAGGGSA
jgi:pimeloyl-ACP methyl ester carboxylesterase